MAPHLSSLSSPSLLRRILPLQMEKSDKTMAEMNIELNLSYEFDKITEAGEALEVLSGPG